MKYKVFAITGTSGVGKSFLEKVLEEEHNFHRMKTYTTRSKRPEEKDDPARISISEEEYDDMLKEFFFTLDYHGNRYGWRRDEYEENIKKTNVLVVMTLEAMTRFVVDVPESIPVLLHIEKNNLDLLKNRLKQRNSYDEVVDIKEKASLDKMIKERLMLAEDEISNINYYISVVNAHDGKVFTIKDDKTLFDEVIPWMINN